MTTELEEQFFKMFKIKPIKYILPLGPLGQNFYWQDGSRIMQEADYKMFKIIENDLTEEDKKLVKSIYPEITDRKLLEIICVLSQSYPLNYEARSFYTIQDLKEMILKDCIKMAKKLFLSSVFANKIQQLFKEGE